MSERDAPGGSPTGADPTPELDRLEQFFRSIPVPDVPHDLSADIMTAVQRVEADLSPWRKIRRARRSEAVRHYLESTAPDGLTEATGGRNVGSKRWVMYAFAGAAAAAIAGFAIFGYPPVIDRTAGTVGAAKRYEGATMSAKDVSVTNADLQRFLQSDTWDRLLKNKASRTALQNIFSNKALTQAMANPEFLHELGMPALGQLLSNASLDAALTDPNFIQALEAPGVAVALSDLKVQAALSDADVQAALLSPGVASALTSADILRALQSQNLHDPQLTALSATNAGLFRLLGNQAFQQALTVPGFIAAISNVGLMHAFGQQAFASAYQQGLFRNFVGSQLAVSALSTPAFAQALQDASLQAAFAQGNFEAALSDAAFASAFANVGFQQQLQASLAAGLHE